MGPDEQKHVNIFNISVRKNSIQIIAIKNNLPIKQNHRAEKELLIYHRFKELNFD